jgi:hypothetical protein
LNTVARSWVEVGLSRLQRRRHDHDTHDRECTFQIAGCCPGRACRTPCPALTRGQAAVSSHRPTTARAAVVPLTRFEDLTYGHALLRRVMIFREDFVAPTLKQG